MILEAVMLNIKFGEEQDFERAFKEASSIISSMNGYLSHELHRCLEVKGKYLLLVRWQTLEDHTIGFRESFDNGSIRSGKDCFIVFTSHFQPLSILNQ
jgi:heme-degrading monooxygenase HmoA